MQVHIGPEIWLPTKHGEFQLKHIVVQDGASLIREGVALERSCNCSPILVRLQSSCLFSETFWATDCDCALQIQNSLSTISQKGGLLLYFYEEGRGAGLAAKFKAIELQQRAGMDTRAAYECLEIKPDERTYEAAAAALNLLLGDKPICLLSNNPDKIDGLKRYKVNIVSTENLIVGTDSAAVRHYLNEKREVLGHDIPKFDE